MPIDISRVVKTSNISFPSHLTKNKSQPNSIRYINCEKCFR